MTEVKLSEEKIFDYIDGFFAWDEGCTDSGIKDCIKREEIFNYIKNMNMEEKTKFFKRFIDVYFINDKKIEEGYIFEDVKSFLVWLDENGLLLGEKE